MKKIKIINTFLLCVFALLLFQGDDVSASGRRGYDVQIKSDISQIRNAVEICFDENGGGVI